MSFRWGERPESRSGSLQDRTQERVYFAAGSSDETYVQAAAVGLTPAIIADAMGLMYRQDIRVSWESSGFAEVTVAYGPKQKNEGEFSLSFDTTGGTLHLKTALTHVADYPAGAPNHAGAIGVNGDEVEGTDIVVPALKLTATFRHPAGFISLPQIKNLARITGQVNSHPFLTFEAGEVLFLGCTGDEGTSSPTSISYQLACSENLQNQIISAITVTEKKGWDVSWVEFEDNEDAAGKPIRKPKAIHIEQVYRRTNFVTGLGFGG